jgi:hypothetical protein
VVGTAGTASAGSGDRSRCRDVDETVLDLFLDTLRNRLVAFDTGEETSDLRSAIS